jgi:hypothetical protein
MTDFEPLSWEEVRRDYREQPPAEDVEFDVTYEDQIGPAWDVWALSYPQRESDARKYLVQIDVSDGVYWYRDTRDERLYGMPDIDLVRRENERLAGAAVRAESRHDAIRRVHYAVGMFAFLSLVLLGLAPDVIPWIWVALPFLVVAYRHALNHAPAPRYDKLTDIRFDVFVSDEEKRERRRRLIANVVTLGATVLLIWLFSRH